MSKSRLTLLLVTVACAIVVLALLLGASAPQQRSDAPSKANANAPSRAQANEQSHSAPQERVISVAATYKNLSLVLFRGPDRIRSQRYLTLGEALEQEKMTVHETGAVDQLALDNDSDTPVFIQSGEIVRGGKQDRVLRYDMIASAQAKGVPLASFCVERGRWRSRGKEASSKFSASSNIVASKELRVNSLVGNQAGVWRQVGNVQGKLSSKLGAAVNAPSSPTSLELSMNNKELKRRTGEYLKSIKRSIRTRLGGMQRAVGFAFAVNGEISSVQIYARGELFLKLFPKLLRAAAVEALSEHKKGRRYQGLRGEAVRRFMRRARKGKRKTLRLSDRVKIHIRATQKSVAYHTYDLVAKGVLHESYLAAGEDGVGRLGHRLDPGSRRNNALGGLISNQVGGGHGISSLVGNQIGEANGIGLGSLGTGRGVGSLRGRRVRTPRVTAGGAVVRGALAKEIVSRITRRHINEVKYCYQKELQANPRLQGRLVIQFTIAATGQVVVSRVLSSTLGNAKVEQCIAMAVRRWLFPRPRDRGAVVVTYPLVLNASGGR
jgi:hypothetical protein